MELDQETIETPAGPYTLKWFQDESNEQPFDEGFGLVRIGDRNSIDIITSTTEHADTVASLIRYHRYDNACDGNIYDYEIRSAAAIARYARLKHGLRGVVEIDENFRPYPPSADKDESFVGLAWAPDDVPDENVATYVVAALKEWHAWAEGDVFGWVLTAPDGTEVEAVWNYYGFYEDNGQRAYTLTEATDTAQRDAYGRVTSANLVGSGLVGLI